MCRGRSRNRLRACKLKSKKTRIEIRLHKTLFEVLLQVEIQENKDWNTFCWNLTKSTSTLVEIQENKDWNYLALLLLYCRCRVEIQENKDWNSIYSASPSSWTIELKSKKTRIEILFSLGTYALTIPSLKSKKTRIEINTPVIHTIQKPAVKIQENKDWNSLFSSSVWQRNSSWNPRKQGLKLNISNL